jgi:hypothetical protein
MTFDVPGAIHMHSDYSHDGLDSLEHLREVCIARGIRWVGITDHAEDLDEEVFGEYLAHCASLSDDTFRFTPGLEFRFGGFRGVHLFAVGLDRWIQPRTFDEFFDQTDTAARFTVLAHPVLCRYVVPPTVLDRVDAIEIWNTNYNTRYFADPRAIALYHTLHARRPEVVATVGLDQHDSSNDREVRTLISSDDFAAPADALKAGRFRTIGRNAAFDSTASMSAGEMRSLRIRRSAFDVVERVQNRVVIAIRRLAVSR